MKLKVKIISLDTGGKSICVINIKDAMEFGVHPLDKIVLRKGGRRATVTVDVSKDFVEPGSIVVYNDVRDSMKLKTRDIVHAEARKPLVSKHYIRRKTDGAELNYNELLEIVSDVVARNLNDLELASFITALHVRGLTLNESFNMSRAMIKTGKKLKFSGKVVDKHSIGGVPGDKTSMLVVPIITAAGLTMPKTSSRSITSPAGTADRMEVLAPVELDTNEIKRVVKKTGGCLVWGGAVDMAPADDLFIRIEHSLGLDPLLLPSVMSKKASVGCKYLVIDIPTGNGSKIDSKESAERLASEFIELGKKMNIKVDCAVTRGDQPVGYAIGPALEAREALQNLTGKTRSDVFDKATSIAGILFGMVGKGNKKLAEEMIKSGKAEAKMREIIGAQGGNPRIKIDDIAIGDFEFHVRSRHSGLIDGINNRAIVDICRSAGTPNDKGAGVLLGKKTGEVVKKGDIIFTIYAEKSAKLRSAIKTAKSYDVYSMLSKNRMLMEKI